jgi:hypothetical protein
MGWKLALNEPVKNADRPEETVTASITWSGSAKNAVFFINKQKMPSVQFAVFQMARESHSLIDSPAIHA